MKARLALICAATALAAVVGTNPAVRSEDKKTYPKQVLLIRHGEQPPEKDPSPDLSDRGKKRADALPDLFKKSPTRPRPFATPDFIFATKATRQDKRAVETVRPLARSLNMMKINDSYSNSSDGIDKLAREILSEKIYDRKTVVICWADGGLLAIGTKLGAWSDPKQGDSPDRAEDSFDQVWILNYDDKGKVVFASRPQQLLPGDADK